jgi:Tfp pilus assembly protein PilX
MADTRNRPTNPGERGIALIMVILLLLVLTALGITATMLMTQEDRISSRQETQKAAFYAADAGLRRGEAILQAVPYTNANLTALLAHTSVANTAAVTPTIPQPPGPWDNAHLGTYLTNVTAGGTELANQEVTQLVGAGSDTFNRVRAYYSLYVRNNPEDTTPGSPLTTPQGGLPSPLVNYDTRLRLVSVGFITDANGVDANGNANVLAVKILEEELDWNGGGVGNPNQIDVNAGATNSGLWTGS